MNESPGDMSRLLAAVMSGDTAAVDGLLQNGATANARDHEGRPVILIASERGYVDIVASLIRAGGEVNLQTEEPPKARTNRRSPPTLHSTVPGKFRLEDEDSLGPPPRALEAAIRAGHLECVRLLLDKGASLRATIMWGDPPLIWAAANPDPAFVRALVAAGAPIDDDSCSDTPLVHAVISGNEDVVRALLDLGANPKPEVRGEDGWGTPLHAAAGYNRLSIARLLIKLGANPKTKDSGGYTPIDEAAGNGHVEMFEFLAPYMPPGLLAEKRETLESALPPDRRPLRTPEEKLLHAAAYLDMDLMLAALREGADVHASDKNGYTALHKVVYWGNPDFTKVLLEAGADPNCPANGPDGGRETPLHRLARARITADAIKDLKAASAGLDGAARAVALLVAAGANLDARDVAKYAPLTAAAIANNQSIMKILVHAGAATDNPKDGGRSVKHFVAGLENFAGRRDRMLEILGGIGEKERAAIHQADLGRELRNAVMTHRLDAVDDILNSGFEVRSDAGEYALATAVNASRDASEIVARLLAAGADPNAAGVVAYHTLEYPFMNGMLKTIRLLLDAGMRILPDTLKKLKSTAKRRLKKKPSVWLEEAVALLQRVEDARD